MLDLSTILKSGGEIVNKVMTVHDAAIGQNLRITQPHMTGLISIYILQENVWGTVSGGGRETSEQEQQEDTEEEKKAKKHEKLHSEVIW